MIAMIVKLKREYIKYTRNNSQLVSDLDITEPAPEDKVEKGLFGSVGITKCED